MSGSLIKTVRKAFSFYSSAAASSSGDSIVNSGRGNLHSSVNVSLELMFTLCVHFGFQYFVFIGSSAVGEFSLGSKIGNLTWTEGKAVIISVRYSKTIETECKISVGLKDFPKIQFGVCLLSLRKSSYSHFESSKSP